MTTFIPLTELPRLDVLYGRVVAHTVDSFIVKRNDSLVLPELGYRIDEVPFNSDQVEAYQHLMGEPGTDAVPPGAVHLLGFRLALKVMARTDFPLRVLGMVHISNSVQQWSPLRIQDRVSLRAWAQNLAPHRSGTQVELVVEAERDGELAWRGVSTYLNRGRTLPGLGQAAPTDTAPTVLPEATASWRLPADTGRAYARVSGDTNPIHRNALTARLFGFRRAIAHGMYTAGRALATIGPTRGEAFSWTAEFRKPVFLPGTVSFGVDHHEHGYRYAGWAPDSDAIHFTGSVTAL
ncbi:MAG: MaoC/PaaZ C-terminal domain-containing protein [Beutenbergiaceae bacterium]